LKKVITTTKKISSKISLNPIENIILFQSEGLHEIAQKWKIIDILSKTTKESWENNPFFSQTLSEM
jgi:hypothetical protein